MTKNTAILSANQEFFTIVATGESGVSIRGLAKLSGIPKSTLTRWFDSDLSGKSVPDPLKALPSKGNPVTQKEGVEGLKALPSKGNPVTQKEGVLYLSPEIAALCTLIESSTSRQDFETRWARVHGLDQQEFINV